MDVLSAEQRHRCMTAIKSTDTLPELTVRRVVSSLGFRYRLHRKDLPGSPDLVFGPARKVIFVHGCFWHLHRCRYGRVRPITNALFWQSKRDATRLRDRRNLYALNRLGWSALVVWECQLKRPALLADKILAFLRQE